jgi:hypothetical protein
MRIPHVSIAVSAGLSLAACTQQVSDSCFVAGTWIATARGARRIEDVAVGDLVLSFDLEARVVVSRQVVALHRDTVREIRRLAMAGHTIVGVTPNPV